jgi:LAO/AO transport system kinase
MKAGIMEMADIFVVSKSDLPGAQRMATDIRRIAAVMQRSPDAWVAPILLTCATQPASVRALSEAIDRHQAWQAEDLQRRSALHAQRARYRLKRLLELRIADAIARQDTTFFDAPLTQQLRQALDAVRASLELQPSKGSPC